MIENFRTPSIAVAIGRSSRVFHLYVTEAPSALDAPSTITLHEASASDLAGFADKPVRSVQALARGTGRLILVDSLHLDWQRARCREAGARLTSADAVLFAPAILERWLWQRLQAAPFPRLDAERLSIATLEHLKGGQYVQA